MRNAKTPAEPDAAEPDAAEPDAVVEIVTTPPEPEPAKPEVVPPDGLVLSAVGQMDVREITADVVEMLKQSPDSHGLRAAKILREINAPPFIDVPETRFAALVRVARVINDHVPKAPEPVPDCWFEARNLLDAALAEF